MKPSLQEMILSTIERYPNQVLLKDDLVSLTGSDIKLKLERILALIKCRTIKGERVGVCFCNSASQALSILAAVVSGRIPVILNYSDVVEKTDYWMAGCKAPLFLVGEELLSRMNESCLLIDRQGNCDEEIIQYPQGDEQGSQSPSVVAYNLTEIYSQFGRKTLIGLSKLTFIPHEGTAFILYTSGSTGEPKEIQVPAAGVIETSLYLIEYFSLSSDTVAPIVLSACHSMALNTQFFPTFFAGGCSYFANLRLIINKVTRFFLTQKPTFVALIGEVVRTCWDEKHRKNLPSCDSVKHVQLAGGLISHKHIEMTREIFPHAKIHKGYGLTEAIRVTMISSDDPLFNTHSVGKALPFIQAEVRDEVGEKLPPGQIGELFVKGSSVMIGCRRLSEIRPQLTVQNEFLATGDLAETDREGNLFIIGRTDSLFKFNGQRVSGFEIEKAAIDAHASIRFAKCLVVDDQVRCRPKMVLFLEVDKKYWVGGGVEIPADIESQLWINLKRLKIYPKEVVFLRHMPTTSNGKLNLKKLRELSEYRELEALKKQTAVNLNLFQISEVL